MERRHGQQPLAAGEARKLPAGQARGTHDFFLPPFFPLEMRLFFPTAMLSSSTAARGCWGMAAQSRGRSLEPPPPFHSRVPSECERPPLPGPTVPAQAIVLNGNFEDCFAEE